jgi:ribosome-binding ATPase YchF (GTP1/OBG family)|tara:strand:- start:3290 stop:3535 length:246 start_codon:yes stop_codon:yes gene_type:complete
MLNSKSTAIDTPKDKSKVLKTIQIFVESNIEFTIEIDDPKATCGWLQSEVVRKYYEVLERQAEEWQQQQEKQKSEGTPYNK